MKLQDRIEQLYKQLDAELTHVPRGERFCSVRRLMDRYNVNKRVIDGALRRMEEQGLIVRQARCGIFSNVTRRKRAHHLLLVMPDWPSPGHQVLIDTLRTEMERRGNYCLQVRLLREDADSFQVEEDDPCEAVLWIPAPRLVIDREVMMRLLTLAVPVVLLGSPPDVSPLCSLAGDDIQAGMLACQRLIAAGRRRLVVVWAEVSALETRMRTEAFCSYARLHEASVRVLNCHTNLGESPCQRALEVLREDLAVRGVDFDGLFVLCDFAVPGVYAALREFQLRVPEDVAVIGHDGYDPGKFYQPPLTTIAHDEELRCKILLDKLDELFSGRITSFKEVFPGYLVERGSVNAEPVDPDDANQ